MYGISGISSLCLLVNAILTLKVNFQVRMLGTGRPFLVEIQNARQVPSEALIKQAEIKINSLEHKLVCATF